MASDHEDSRTATLGRKRRQNNDAVQSVHQSDKRQRLEDNADYLAFDTPDNDDDDSVSDENDISNDSRRESGEVSVSAESSRRASKASEALKQASANVVQIAQSPVPIAASMDLRDVETGALFPESLQTFVQEQMTLKDTSADAILNEILVPGQPFRKHARDFVSDWKKGYRASLSEYRFSDLQRLVNDPNVFRKPLDVDAMMKSKSKKSFVSDSEIGRALRADCSKTPGRPAAAVLLDLLKTHKFHVKACQVLRAYLDGNLLRDVSQDDGTITKAADTADKARQQSSSTSEGEISESDEAEMNSNDDIIRLSDISVEEQALQYRYFHLSDPGDSVYCLCCGERGHMQHSCPALTCQHCKSNTHFSHGCPVYQKCERCRERGHRSKGCNKRSKPAGAPGDDCDICAERGHAEEECAGLWLTFKPDHDNINKITSEEMVVSCYNCGREGHWGDDCKNLPDYVIKDIMHTTWSAKNANKYIIGAAEEKSGRAGVNGGASVKAHQLTQLGDWM